MNGAIKPSHEWSQTSGPAAFRAPTLVTNREPFFPEERTANLTHAQTQDTFMYVYIYV